MIILHAAPHDSTSSQNSVLTHDSCQNRLLAAGVRMDTVLTSLLHVLVSSSIELVGGKLGVFVNRIYVCISHYSH